MEGLRAAGFDRSLWMNILEWRGGAADAGSGWAVEELEKLAKLTLDDAP